MSTSLVRRPALGFRDVRAAAVRSAALPRRVLDPEFLRSPSLPRSLPPRPPFSCLVFSDSEALSMWRVGVGRGGGGSRLLGTYQDPWNGDVFFLSETALNKFQLPRYHLFCGLSVGSFHPCPMAFWLTFLCPIDDSTSPRVLKPVSAPVICKVVKQSHMLPHQQASLALGRGSRFATVSDPEGPGLWEHLALKRVQYVKSFTLLL